MKEKSTLTERLLEMMQNHGARKVHATRLSEIEAIAANSLTRHNGYKTKSEFMRQLIMAQVKKAPQKVQREILQEAKTQRLKLVKTTKGKCAFVPLTDPRPAAAPGVTLSNKK